MFGKKEKISCPNCRKKNDKVMKFCPNCGYDLRDPEKYNKEFGLLGEEDSEPAIVGNLQGSGLGITDKIVNSVLNNLMKSFEKQFKDLDKQMMKDMENAKVESTPNGIRIRISSPNLQGNPQNKTKKKKTVRSNPKKEITPEQQNKISKLPRSKAKSSIKRLSDTIVYELETPGVLSTDDIFISKIEEGYEIKAIGNDNVYVNSLPLNLPLSKLTLNKDRLFVEFLTEE